MTEPKNLVEIERMQTGVRMEKRLLKVLKAVAELKDMSLGDLLEGIVLCRQVQWDLVIAWRYIQLIGENPDLQEFGRFTGAIVVFAVEYAFAGAHHLDLAFAHDAFVS